MKYYLKINKKVRIRKQSDLSRKRGKKIALTPMEKLKRQQIMNRD